MSNAPEPVRSSFTDAALSLAARTLPDESAKSILDRLLPALKAWTGSSLAFAATVEEASAGQYCLLAGTGDEILRDQTELWDTLFRDQQAWIKSPPGDARLSSLMGWPLRHGAQLIGVIGLANRPAGYDEDLLRSVQVGLVIAAGLVATALLTQSSQQSLDDLSLKAGNLRASKEQYRHIFEVAGVGLCRVGLDGRFLDVNQRFADIAGRTREALLGLTVADITYAEDWGPDFALMEETVRGQQDRYQTDKRYIRPDGSIVWVALTAVLVRDAQGRPAHFVSVVEDIGDRLRYEEAITSAKAAERASKAKTEFLSRMSHELRTPLNAMLGFAQLLRVDPRHPLNDNQLQKVQHIERAGAHLLAMLTDVLDLSRIEAGSLPLSLEATSVVGVMQEACALVQHQVEEAGLQLQLTLPEQPVFALADQVRLRQILVNLLSNAIKYNRPQGRIMLEALALSPHVVITVSDTGKGLSEEQQAHLFEPFNRLGAEKTNIEGTGIGLVIVKRLVDLMQGRMDVSSALHIGSRFRIWLNEASPDMHVNHGSQEALLRPRQSGFGSLDGAEGGQLSLLYAEDNPINVELVRQVLRMRPQWHLDVATHGAQAIEMALASPPDLLLLDMHLGDMNGTDVSDELARHPHTADIPRVALSADVMPDQIHEARERGFVEYLSKPLEVPKLLRILDQCAKSLGPT
ncbi:MAG TPA: ATP-binding protein [Aquabacterium sp.]|nr:ATP-binding protein [Aquabacterium sp.]